MRLAIDAIIKGKHFYREHYRRNTRLLYVSLIISLCLLAGIVFLLTIHTESDFYASNGVAAPVLLAPLSAPNMSSQPLIASMPAEKAVVEVARSEIEVEVGE